MGLNNQPFMYEPVKNDSRFPQKDFDPKAVTRASWEAKPPKSNKKGPLVNFNHHPDAHSLIGSRKSVFKPMGQRTKSWIKRIRKVQLGLRVLELNGGLGILTLMILISNTGTLMSLVMRITAGAVIVHTSYSIYHHSKPARSRTPASSAAYQLFSGLLDLAVMPLYAYGALSAHNDSGTWDTLLNNKSLLAEYFVPSLYYTLIGAGGLHLLSFSISLSLGLMFRRITQMPPDMNPLEDHLTARISSRHKRNKSSVATYSTVSADDVSEKLSRPSSIPFMHTRTNSRDSKRDSRLDLPSRQYQIQPSNSSPRNSFVDLSLNVKRSSVPSGRASYVSVPSSDNYVTYPASSRPSSATIENASEYSNGGTSTPRQAKFTEAWYTSDSLIDRTHKRAQVINADRNKDRKAAYEQLSQRYNFEANDSDDDETHLGDGNKQSESDPSRAHREMNDAYLSSYYAGENLDLSSANFDPSDLPDPLGSHPTNVNGRPKTPYRNVSEVSALSEISLNDRRVSGGCDIADIPMALSPRKPGTPAKYDKATTIPNAGTPTSNTKRHTYTPGKYTPTSAAKQNDSNDSDLSYNSGSGSPSKNKVQKHRSLIGRMPTKWEPRQRDSSIQQEDGLFSAKPYGELKAATPPVMIGSSNLTGTEGGRQISSGNDYYNDSFGGISSGDLGAREGSSRYAGASTFGRRNVSGKVAEEGRSRWSRFSVLNDD